MVNVKKGQYWRDNDSRITKGEAPKRTVRVLEVSDTHARVNCIQTGRESRVRLDRFVKAFTLTTSEDR